MSDNFARLLALMSNGGGGGVSSYNDLTDLPSIGGTTIIGNLTLADIGVVIDNQLDATSTNPVQNAIITAALNNLSYNNLSNKPSINNVTLTGNTTLAELGLYAIWIGTNAELEAAIEDDEIADGTIILLTDDPDVDNLPTENSTNLVYSGGVYTFVTQGLSGKVDAVQGKGLSTNDYTDAEKTQVATNKNDITALKAEHVELTQTEYDMIGNEKYSDNKEYFIVDASPDDPTHVYGFHIDPDESDSSDCVTYLADAVGMTPAAMGSTTFNYGSWADAFFMPKPCMLKFDGTVDYYLDPNDYSKKADGVTPSDYNNLAYQGNAMMEFPLIWYKYVPGVAEGEGYFYVSNHKVNDTYKCWSNMDCDGNIIEHFYMPIYNGCTYDGKMRSISGLTLAPWDTTAYSASATYAVGAKVNYDGKMWKCTTAVETAEAFDPEKWEQFAFNGNTTATEEIAQATACNTTAKTEWYIDTWNDRVLINGLLVLISKSIDTQGAFGRGIDSGSQAAKESYVTGSLDDKGLFYGSTANGTTAVKVFGMENWWSLVWHRTAGLISGANSTYLYKMTASTADGSIADGYNMTGTGYPSVGGRPTTSSYVKKMQFGLFGFLPIEVGAYSTQYYKDYYYNGSGFALVGGASHSGASAGAFAVALYRGASYRDGTFAAAPSCKPYLRRGELAGA